jgi:hypothetical protein
VLERSKPVTIWCAKAVVEAWSSANRILSGALRTGLSTPSGSWESRWSRHCFSDGKDSDTVRRSDANSLQLLALRRDPSSFRISRAAFRTLHMSGVTCSSALRSREERRSRSRRSCSFWRSVRRSSSSIFFSRSRRSASARSAWSFSRCISFVISAFEPDLGRERSDELGRELMGAAGKAAVLSSSASRGSLFTVPSMF